ncbi:MAG: MBL fold metallo-hydrolase [Solirubrobacterales bacterium]
MIAAARRDREFLADLEATAAEPSSLHAWWLGQSGFLVARGGERLLLDPYLSESLTAKYAGTATPHVRMTERVVDPAELRGLAAVLASHHHTDHLDGETLRAVLAASPEAALLVPAAHRELAAERTGLGAERIVGMDDGVRAEVGGFRVEGVPAAHERIERDAEGRMVCLGYAVSVGPFRLYHAGDTVPYDGMAARIGPVDLALLPVNGRDPARGVAGNMDGVEAAELAAALPARTAVPCHFEMFEFNTASPESFLAACERLGVSAARLRAGERVSLAT